MPVSGGEPNNLYYLRPDGNAEEHVSGNHRGPAQALNVHNPQPGYMYYWVKHPRTDRGSQLQRFVNLGYEVCGASAPEHKGREASLNYSEMGLDNYQVHGDLVLLKIKEEKYKEMREWLATVAKAAKEGPTAEYEEKGRNLNLPERYSRADGPIYYKGPGHGIHS
jgi:hypothetical protein